MTKKPLSFPILNFPFLDGDLPLATSNGIYFFDRVTNDHRYVPLVVELSGPFLIHDLSPGL
jgi:hypothetical protein